MASTEKLAPSLPETLPEDFFDWDGEASSAPSPDHSGEREAWEAALSLDEIAKPHRQSASHDTFRESPVDRPRVSGSAPAAPVFVKQQKDLVNRNGDAIPAAAPRNPWEREAWEAALSFGKTAKSPGQSADREVILPPVVKKPRVSDSASTAPDNARKQELASASVDESPSRASQKPEASQTANGASAASRGENAANPDGIRNSPEFKSALRADADEVIFQLFSPKNIEALEEPKTSRKKWMIVAPVSAGSIVLLLVCMIPLFHHGAKAESKQSIQLPPATTETQPQTDTPKPTAKGQSTQNKPQATTGSQQTTGDQSANGENAVKPGEAQKTMMTGQLAAPTTIPKQVAENEPPPASFGAAGSDGLGGNSTNPSLFKGRTQPVMNAFKPIVISSGVATGMLIRKTEPVYPTIAKAARVSGTVVLHANISKTGTIMDLQVVSGPPMLRSAALDAVRTWRYKPYQLNNQRTEVETTINVIFALAG
jgi:TonB family protein